MKRYSTFLHFLGMAAIILLLSSFLLIIIQPAHTQAVIRTMLQTSPTVVAHVTLTLTVTTSQRTNSIGQSLFTFFSSPLGLLALTILVGGPLAAFLTYVFNRRQKRKEVQEAETKEARKEVQRQQQEAADLRAKQQAETQSIENAVQSYRDALLNDSTIASIQILDMDRPIELVNVYVQLRLHQDPKTTYATDLLLEKDTTWFDPNILLEMARKRFEDANATKVIDPVVAIKNTPQCVLLGDPGAGKTTLLKYLTIQSVKKQLTGLPDLPIHIELSEFVKTQHKTLLDFALERWENYYNIPQAVIGPYVREQIKAGKVLWLLDGLDETALGKTQDDRNASYKRVLDAIMQIATPLPKAHIVVTARFAGYRQRTALAGFTELEVMQLRPEDIHTFIDQWFKSTDTARVEMGAELNRKLEDNIRLQTLAANPLMLSLIVYLREKKLNIPEFRVDLYERCVNLLLEEWDKKRNVQRHSELSLRQQKTLLQNIAWQFHTKNVRYLSDDEVLDTITAFLNTEYLPDEKAELVLEEMTADNGLLKQQAEGWYGFLHLTFQEYFTALYVDKHALLDNLLQHRNEPWWEEVILLYAGSTRELTPLLKKLLGQDSTYLIEDDIFSTNVLLSARCLAARPTQKKEQTIAPLKQEVIQRLFTLLLDTDYTLSRQQAADALTELARNDEAITKHLLQLLANTNSTHTAIAESIATAFSRYGERSLMVKLLRLFFDTQIDDDVNGSIGLVLKKLQNDAVERALIAKILDKNESASIRSNCINALNAKSIRSHGADLLTLLLDKQEDYIVRFALALAWGSIEDATLTAPLLTLLTTSPQSEVESKSVSAIALSSLAHLDRPVLTALLAFSSDPSLSIARNWQTIVLSNIIYKLDDASFDNDIVNIIRGQSSTLQARKDFVEYLGIAHHVSIKTELQKLYDDPQIPQELHEQLGTTLYMLGDRSVSIDTEGLLTKAQRFGSLELYVLEQMDTSMQLQLLTKTSTPPTIRSGIADTIARANEVSAVPVLRGVALNKKAHAEVRIACVKALGTLADDRETVQTLVDLLNTHQIEDEVQQTLWKVSRRAQLRIVTNPLTRQVRIA